MRSCVQMNAISTNCNPWFCVTNIALRIKKNEIRQNGFFSKIKTALLVPNITFDQPVAQRHLHF